MTWAKGLSRMTSPKPDINHLKVAYQLKDIGQTQSPQGFIATLVLEIIFIQLLSHLKGIS